MGKIYAKCGVEGCTRSIIWEQTYKKLPLCPNCTRMFLVIKWYQENIKVEAKAAEYNINKFGNIQMQ